MTRRRPTFTDGIYILAAIGGAAVITTGLGVIGLITARFIEEMQQQRARAVRL